MLWEWLVDALLVFQCISFLLFGFLEIFWILHFDISFNSSCHSNALVLFFSHGVAFSSILFHVVAYNTFCCTVSFCHKLALFDLAKDYCTEILSLENQLQWIAAANQSNGKKSIT